MYRYRVALGEVRKLCCYGYVIDLLITLRDQLKIKCDLHLVGDGEYGKFDYVSTYSISAAGFTKSYLLD